MTELAQEINDLYDYLKKPLDRSTEGLIQELDSRGQWLARAAEILADTQVALDKRRGVVAEQYLGTEESWNIIKHKIESECADEKQLYVLAERLNAVLTHQMDEVRSILSFEKQSMAQLREPSATRPKSYTSTMG